MWFTAYGRLVAFRTTSMSRVMAAVVRKSEPMPPRPPWLDTEAANSPDVAEPMGARMIGTSMPSRSQRAVLSMGLLLGRAVRPSRMVSTYRCSHRPRPSDRFPSARPAAARRRERALDLHACAAAAPGAGVVGLLDGRDRCRGAGDLRPRPHRLRR